MGERAALTIALEFARTDRADDPFAFRVAPQVYTLRGEGGGVETVEVAWDEALRADLAAVARRGCAPAVVQRLGDRLRAILLSGGWERHEAALAAAAGDGRPVRLVLRSAAAELYALPWELATIGASGRHLGEVPGVLVEYTWPESQTAAEDPSPPPEGGRVLCAWSAAGGAVPAAEHVKAIAAAAAEGRLAFDAAADVVPHASLAGLSRALEAARAAGRPATALHLLCHGGRRGATVGLWLSGQADEPALVDPSDLRRVLAPHAGALRLVVLAACSASDPGELGNHLGSAAQAIHRAGVAAVVASRFPLTVPGSIALTRALYRGLAVELGDVESAVLAARSELARDPDALDWAGLQLYARAEDDDVRPFVVRPYRGLLAFEPEHRRFFFGRAAKVAEIVDELAALRAGGRPRLLVVAGASGTGKSSLVLAGAAPRALAGEGAPELLRMRPGRAPLTTLEELLAGRTDPRRACLLVVDQLEELFTHAARSDAQAFARRLWQLVGEAGGPVSAVATLRIDFIGACAEIGLDAAGARLDQIACDPRHAVLVPQMGPDDLRAVIERPAALVGLSFEPGLVGRILDDLGGAPGGLPLLADTLDVLWQRRTRGALTQAAYEAIGGVTGALEGRAEALIGGLDGATLRLVRRVLVGLVSARRDELGDTRQRARVDALRPADPALAGRFDEVVRLLVDARLAVRGEDAGAATLELAHEALIRRWPRLQGWLREDAERLAALAELAGWVHPWKSHGTLLFGHALGYAVELARRHPDDIGADARALIDASLAAEAARQRRRRRALLGALAAAAALAGLTVLALVLAARAREAGRRAGESAREARLAEKTAAKTARRARDAALVTAARLARDDQHTAALLLREVEGPALQRGWLAAAVEVIHGVPPPTLLPGHTAEIRGLAFSGDGAWLATASDDRTVRLSPLAGGPAIVLEHPAAVVDVAVSAGGERVATVAADRQVRLWRREEPRAPVVLAGAPSEPVRVAFSPDGARLAAAGYGSPVVWPGDGTGAGRALACPEGMGPAPGGAVPLAWSPDGRRLAAPCRVGPGVWTVDDGSMTSLEALGDVVALRFDAAGTRVAVLDGRGGGASWFVDGGKAVREEGRFGLLDVGFLGGSFVWAERPTGGPVVDAALLGPRGDGLFLTAEGGINLVRRTGETTPLRGPPVQRAEMREGARFPGAWSPDGERAAIVGADQVVRVWSAEGQTDPPVWRDASRRAVRAEFRPDGAALLLYGRDGIREVTIDGVTSRALERPGLEVSHAAYAPDGAQVAIVGPGGEVLRWRPASGEVVVEQSFGASQDYEEVAWSPDGRSLALLERAVRVWRLGGPARALGCERASANCVAWSPDGRRLALGCADGSLAVRAAEGEGPAVLLPASDGAVLDVAWSPDGQRVAAAHWDAVARVWRRDGEGEPVVLRGHLDRVLSVAWSPDGRGLATAGRDGTARLWSADGAPLGRLEVAARAALGARWSSDGRRVLVWSSDGVARVFWADGGDHPLVFPAFGDEAVRARWSPDGRRIAVAGRGGAALYLADVGLADAWLEGHVRGCMSVEARIAALGEEREAAEAARAACEAGGAGR